MKQITGKAWINQQCRPIYDNIHEIKRGKNKGKIVVYYLSGFQRYKKIIIRKSDIIEYQEYSECQEPKRQYRRKQ